MKISKANHLILDNQMELISLEGMLEDLPYYLGLQGVNLSAISVSIRREMLAKIKIILQNGQRNNTKKHR